MKTNILFFDRFRDLAKGVFPEDEFTYKKEVVDKFLLYEKPGVRKKLERRKRQFKAKLERRKQRAKERRLEAEKRKEEGEMVSAEGKTGEGKIGGEEGDVDRVLVNGEGITQVEVDVEVAEVQDKEDGKVVDEDVVSGKTSSKKKRRKRKDEANHVDADALKDVTASSDVMEEETSIGDQVEESNKTDEVNVRRKKSSPRKANTRSKEDAAIVSDVALENDTSVEVTGAESDVDSIKRKSRKRSQKIESESDSTDVSINQVMPFVQSNFQLISSYCKGSWEEITHKNNMGDHTDLLSIIIHTNVNSEISLLIVIKANSFKLIYVWFGN